MNAVKDLRPLKSIIGGAPGIGSEEPINFLRMKCIPACRRIRCIMGPEAAPVN